MAAAQRSGWACNAGRQSPGREGCYLAAACCLHAGAGRASPAMWPMCSVPIARSRAFSATLIYSIPPHCFSYVGSIDQSVPPLFSRYR